METLCKICGGNHLAGACQEKATDKKPYDFSYTIPNFQYRDQDPSKLATIIEQYEIVKKTMLGRMEKELSPLYDANPQLSQEGKLNYAITGSYVYLLCAIADEVKIVRLQNDGTLVETANDVGLRPETTKSMRVIPGDLDVIKYSDERLTGVASDAFDGGYSNNVSFVEYKVGERKFIGRHPLDQFAESWVGFAGVFGPERMLGNISKIKDKAFRYETILKSLLQTFSVEDIANHIVGLYLKNRLGNKYGEWLLVKPEAMREHFEQKGSKFEFEMDSKNFSALLTLMKTVSEEAKQKINDSQPVHNS